MQRRVQNGRGKTNWGQNVETENIWTSRSEIAEESEYDARGSGLHIRNNAQADQCEPTIKTVAKLEKALRLPEMTLLELKQKEEGNMQYSNETEEKIVRAFRDLERELLINMTELELQNVSGAINAITDLIKK